MYFDVVMSEKIKIESLDFQGYKINLKISGIDKKIAIPVELAQKFKLVSGIIISESQLNILLEEAELLRCYVKAKQILAIREHSVGELSAKFKKRGFSSNVIEPIIKKLTKLELLDDPRYALKLVQKIISDKPCGRSMVIAYQRKKMISRELAEKTADMVLGNSDQTIYAVSALKKRFNQFAQLELEEARKKSYNYLSRRGFSYEASKKAFEKLFIEMKED